MEKKFKCKDEVIVRLKESGFRWFYGVISHSDDDSVILSGGFRHPYERYDVLPYAGNENLVGTIEDPDEKIVINEGDLVFCFDNIHQLEECDLFLGKFEYINQKQDFCVSGCLWNYCIPYLKFNPNDIESTKKEVFESVNDKIVKVNLI